MNKKFSTFLVSALLFASAGAFAQGPRGVGNSQTLRPIDVMSDVYGTYPNYSLDVTSLDVKYLYQLKADDDRVLIQVRDTATGHVYLKLVDAAQAPINESLWKITGEDGSTNVRGDRFQFINKETNLPLVYDLTQAYNLTADTDLDASYRPTIVNGCQKVWSWYSTSQDLSGATPPIYAYSGDRAYVLQYTPNTETPGNVALVSYSNTITGGNLVSALNHTIQVKPVFAAPLVLDEDGLNSKVDFQNAATGKVQFASTTNVLASEFLSVQYEAENYGTAFSLANPNNPNLGFSAAEIADFVTFKGPNGHLMVSTDLYDVESKFLQLKQGDITAAYGPYGAGDDMLLARFLFRVTYYASHDSLVIEPLNALRPYTNGQWYKEEYAFNSRNNNFGEFTAVAGDPTTNTAELGEVVIRVGNLVNDRVISADNTAEATATDPGTLLTRIYFANRDFPYLTRTTVEPGLYYLQQTTGSLTYKGKLIVDNLNGKLMYDAEAIDQDYNNMPATMWVVEALGCGGSEAVVTIRNREYGEDTKQGAVFTGQLYVDEATGDYFFINRVPERDQMSGSYAGGGTDNVGKFNLQLLKHMERYAFTEVSENDKTIAAYTDKEHGYKTLTDDELVFTKFYLNYNKWSDQGLYLNVVENGFTPTEGQTSSYQLQKVTDLTAADSIAVKNQFGYAANGLDKLERTAYVIKVSDNNLIDNDKMYIALENGGVNPNYYKPVHLDDIKAGKAKIGKFYLKSDQVMQDEAATEAYILIDIFDRDSVMYADNGWVQASVEDGTYSMNFTTLDNNPDARSSAFAIVNEERPLYMPKNRINENVKIYVQRGNAREYLYEDANNALPVPYAAEGVGYLGLTAEGIAPVGNGTTTALYADYVVRSTYRMPQYLFAVDVDSVADGRWCHAHGYFRTAAEHPEHTDFYNGYVAGRYLINLNAFIDADNDIVTNKFTNLSQYKYDNYTRLAFFEAVHQVEHVVVPNPNVDGEDMETTVIAEYLYVCKDGVTLAGLTNEWGVIAPEAFENENNFIKIALTGAHTYYTYALRYTNDDHQDFLMESRGAGSAVGSFEGAWIKVHNSVPVIAELNVNNSNHADDDAKINELITQAQVFNIEVTEEQATSNEGAPEASAVIVIASEGKVTVKGAAGKKVAITNVLGQTVANTVVSSDNATISVPAGVVVVAVEGEKAVKAIVK